MMQRVAAAMVLVVAGVIAMTSIGCVEQSKYDAVLLRNREQEKLLAEKDAQVAALTERINGLMAQTTSSQSLLDSLKAQLASAERERDEIMKAFNDLVAKYGQLTTVGGALPPAVTVALEDLARQYPGILIYDAATGRLRFIADLTFDSGSNVVKPEAKEALTKLAGILTSEVAKPVLATVIGFTDTDRVKKESTIALLKGLGKPASNMGLSEARAEAVADILSGAGVEAARITTEGKGEAEPIAANTTPEGKAKNRRVDVYLSVPGAAKAAPEAAPTPAAPATPKAGL